MIDEIYYQDMLPVCMAEILFDLIEKVSKEIFIPLLKGVKSLKTFIH